MEWYLLLLIILGGLILLMVTGAPIAVCFMIVNVLGVFLFWGGGAGLRQLVLSIFDSLTSFTLMPIPLFVLMGSVMFYSGIAPHMINAVDKWLGALPGRLGLLAVAAGTLFSTLTGASMASVVMLTKTLLPEMEKKGYKKPMLLGPILGSGGLAIMVPPSELAVLLGAIGEISVGRILIAIIIPGILMAVLYALYIIGRCRFDSSVAPPYVPDPTPLREKVVGTVKYVLPLGFIVFMVIGLMLLGVATPTEAAATGALGTFILAAAYKRLNLEVIKKSLSSTLEVVVMIFAIIMGAKAFAQILAFTGASAGLAGVTANLPLPPIMVIATMMVVILFLGTFMSVVAIMMITLPIFVPVVVALGFNPVWFAVMFLINIEMAVTTPPFGLALFAMKGVVPPHISMGDIYRAALPFVGCDMVAITLILLFPAIALWLPKLVLG